MYLDYDSLTKIVASEKPYRGRTSDYPTHGRAFRRHGHKFFRVDSIDDEIVFRINYSHRWNKIPCNEAEGAMLKKLGREVQSGNKIVYDADTHTYTETEEKEYWYYEVLPNEIGIVRPDNTFEFTHEDTLGQGMRHYLENYCFRYATVYTNCKLGGVVLDGEIPLFKGLHIDLENMKPMAGQNIELYKKVINRSAAKELYEPYKEMLSVSKAMLSQMDDKLFITAMKDVLNDHKIVWEWDDKEGHTRKYTSGEDVVKKADELRAEGNYFDSAILYGYGYDLGGITWRIRHNHSWIKREPFINMERYIRKVVYQHKKPFDLKPMQYGKELSASDWGFVIKKDGISVNQYSY
jgi:hypothetical protein